MLVEATIMRVLKLERYYHPDFARPYICTPTEKNSDGDSISVSIPIQQAYSDRYHSRTIADDIACLSAHEVAARLTGVTFPGDDQFNQDISAVAVFLMSIDVGHCRQVVKVRYA